MSTGSANDWLPDSEKLAALAEFAAGAGHEINNPLATIIGRAQQLLRDEADPQRRQSLATIAAQAYRIRDMIGDVMLFARPPAAELADVSLQACTKQVVERLGDDIQSRSCRLTVSSAAEVIVRADPVQLAVVQSELLRNALDALPSSSGVVCVEIACANSFGEWRITDNGRGFSAIERQHAFDPFFSGRQAGRGLGFGLCKVARIVDLHGGDVAITSAPGGPTTVTTRWPCSV